MLVAQLLDAVTALDEDRAHAVLDTAFVERSIESAIIDVLLPLFVRVGEMWELGRIGIAQEHFASSLVRRRLGALSLTWGVGTGPVAVLACPPGEFHDIVLLSFGVLLGPRRLAHPLPRPRHPHPLARRGGAAHPGGCRGARLPPPTGFRGHASALRRLSEDHPVWIAGRGRPRGCSRRSVCRTSAVTSSRRRRRAHRHGSSPRGRGRCRRSGERAIRCQGRRRTLCMTLTPARTRPAPGRSPRAPP